MFKGKAVGGPLRHLDSSECRRALEILADMAAGIELRALPSGRSVVFPSGDIGSLVEAAEAFCLDGQQIYYCLNPVPENLNHAARVADILRRRWLLIDIDPVKAEGHKDDSATDLEKAEARKVADAVVANLSSRGWPLPLVVDSGNGYHLLYRLDLPADEVVRATIKRTLYVLAKKHDTDGARIDCSVHNASRIAKLPGSWACKGPDKSDRPHRPVRLLEVPACMFAVEFKLLVNLERDAASESQSADVQTVSAVMPEAAVPESPEIAPEAPPIEVADAKPLASHQEAAPIARILKGKATGDRSYGKAALDQEIGRVAQAIAGTTEGRNNTLNKAAFSLGQLVAGGELDEREVVAALTSVARQVGLFEDPNCGERGVAATIQSGLEAGKLEPRTAPEKSKPNKGAKQAESSADEAIKKMERLTVQASKIKPKHVDWFWKNRIAKRFLTLFSGRTAVGKSFVLCDIAARMSVGGEIPMGDGELFEVGNALIVSEDPYEYMLVPRLIEMGADMERIHFMSLETMMVYTLEKVDWLERCYEEAGRPKLIAIDPPTSFLGETDEHRNAEIRQVLMKLVNWIQQKDASLVLILHVNKQMGKGVEALSRVLGSVAWTTVSRIAHSFCIDPDDADRSLFVPMKNNLGPLAKGLSFSVVSSGDLAKVKWHGEVDTTANEGMAGEKTQPKKKRGVVAAEWLAELFATVDRLPSKVIYDRKAAETDLSDNGLKEGKYQLKIEALQDVDDDGVRQWFWIWPGEARRRWMLKKKLKEQTTGNDEEEIT